MIFGLFFGWVLGWFGMDLGGVWGVLGAKRASRDGKGREVMGRDGKGSGREGKGRDRPGGGGFAGP